MPLHFHWFFPAQFWVELKFLRMKDCCLTMVSSRYLSDSREVWNNHNRNCIQYSYIIIQGIQREACVRFTQFLRNWSKTSTYFGSLLSPSALFRWALFWENYDGCGINSLTLRYGRCLVDRKIAITVYIFIFLIVQMKFSPLMPSFAVEESDCHLFRPPLYANW